jgi:hypothetical protein
MKQSQLFACAFERTIELPNLGHWIVQKSLLFAFDFQAFEQLPHFGDHRHTADFPVLSSSFCIAANHNFILRETAIPPKDPRRLFQSRSGVGKELNGIRAMRAAGCGLEFLNQRKRFFLEFLLPLIIAHSP